MKKGKRILAIAGIILLVSLYLITLICAITDNTATMRVFMASIFASVVIPVLLWAYSFIYRKKKKNADEEKQKAEDFRMEHPEGNRSLKDKANLNTDSK